MGTGGPFPEFVVPNELEQALVTEQLTPPQSYNLFQPKAGTETWCTAWSSNGAYFAWSQGNGIVKIIPWNRVRHCIVPPSEHNEDHHQLTVVAGELVWSLAFGSSMASTSPHSVNLNNQCHYKLNLPDHVLATGLNNGRIRVWDVKTGHLMIELMDHRGLVRDLHFAPDGSMRLASASRDGTLKMWDLKDDGNMYKTLKSNSLWLFSCAWSPDATMLASVGDKSSVIIWDTKTFQRLHSLSDHHHSVSSCTFSPDGALLATSSFDTRIVIWDPYLGCKLMEMCHMFPPPSIIFAGGDNGSFIRSISFSHDGHHIASVADDQYLRFWDLFRTSCPEQIGQVNNPLSCTYSPDGSTLATGNRDGQVSFFLAPMQVSSLQHLCRMAIRRILPSQHVSSQLQLPKSVINFLLYKECYSQVPK